MNDAANATYAKVRDAYRDLVILVDAAVPGVSTRAISAAVKASGGSLNPAQIAPYRLVRHHPDHARRARVGAGCAHPG